MKPIRLNDQAEVIEKGNTFYLRVPQQQQNRSRFWIGIGLTVLVIGVSVSGWKSTPPPRFLPNGTVITQSGTRGQGKLIIDNGSARDAVIKLIDPKMNRAIASVYVKAKNKAELTAIPDGSYELFVTQGSDWDSAVAKFTDSASYSKFDQVVDFATRTVDRGGLPIQETLIWNITLHPVAQGNTRSEEISQSQFDKY
jgi:hypothetical protein